MILSAETGGDACTGTASTTSARSLVEHDDGAEIFRLLVESVCDYAIIVLHPDGRIASWNGGAERIKGYASNEVVGRHFGLLYSREDVAAGKPDRELAEASRSGRFEDEGWRVRKDGSRFWANVIITALAAPDGTLRGFAKVTRDLTARRSAEAAERARIEEALHAAEERYGLLLELLPHMVFSTAADGTTEYANCRCSEYLGPGVRWEDRKSVV